MFGEDAYPDLHSKAAALLQSLARNRALVVIRVATGVEPDLDKIAEQLRAWSYQEG